MGIYVSPFQTIFSFHWANICTLVPQKQKKPAFRLTFKCPKLPKIRFQKRSLCVPVRVRYKMSSPSEIS